MQGGHYIATDNAYVKGDKVPVSAQFSGTVVSVMGQDIQAEITLSRTKHRFAQREQQRQANLLEKYFISASKFDDAKQNTDLTEQHTQTLEMDLKRIAEALGGNLNSAIESHPSYRLAMALVVTDNWWIEANFSENEITFIQPGQCATVQIDTEHRRRLKGHAQP